MFRDRGGEKHLQDLVFSAEISEEMLISSQPHITYNQFQNALNEHSVVCFTADKFVVPI